VRKCPAPCKKGGKLSRREIEQKGKCPGRNMSVGKMSRRGNVRIPVKWACDRLRRLTNVNFMFLAITVSVLVVPSSSCPAGYCSGGGLVRDFRDSARSNNLGSVEVKL